MTTKSNNALANMALTLVKNDKPTKPSKGIVMLSDTETLNAVSMYAEGIKAGEDSLQTINNALAKFHNAKVKLCKARDRKSTRLNSSH